MFGTLDRLIFSVLLCAACTETPVPSAGAPSAIDAAPGDPEPAMQQPPMAAGPAPSATDAATHDSPPALQQPAVGGGMATADAGSACTDRWHTDIDQLPDTPCDDRDPKRVVDGTNAQNDEYSVTCDEQPLDAVGCKGVPTDIWGMCLRKQCAARQSYPEGCIVYLPTQNPFYAGTPQACNCARSPDGTGLTWLCGI